VFAADDVTIAWKMSAPPPAYYQPPAGDPGKGGYPQPGPYPQPGQYPPQQGPYPPQQQPYPGYPGQQPYPPPGPGQLFFIPFLVQYTIHVIHSINNCRDVALL